MRKLLKGRIPALTVLVTSLSVQVLSATVQANTWEDGWHDGWGWGHMFSGSFMMLLFWGGLIILIILAVRWMGGRSARGGDVAEPGSQALYILEERFSLGEIEELLSLRAEPSADCADVRERAEAKLDEVKAKLVQLARIRDALEQLVAACPGRVCRLRAVRL